MMTSDKVMRKQLKNEGFSEVEGLNSYEEIEKELSPEGHLYNLIKEVLEGKMELYIFPGNLIRDSSKLLVYKRE